MNRTELVAVLAAKNDLSKTAANAVLDTLIDTIKQSLPSIDCIDLLYCDIGTIGDWGRPTNSDGLHAYHAYMSAPWKIAKKNH